MTLKSDAKFEKETVCCFNNDKKLVNFKLNTRRFQKFAQLLVPFVQSI